MDLTLLGPDFKAVRIIDTYEELVWADRFRETGDFELKIPLSELRDISIGGFLTCPASPKVMVIESIETAFDADGERSLVKGRSLESILERRVIVGTWRLNGLLQSRLQAMVRAQCVSPQAYPPFRAFPGLTFDSATTSGVSELTCDLVFSGETVYDVMVDVAKQYVLGFQLVLTPSLGMSMRLVKGRDLTTKVVFTEDNSVFEDYTTILDDTKNRNVAYISGGTDATKKTWELVSPFHTPGGWDRREVYVDGSSVATKDDNDVDIPEAVYREMLNATATTALAGMTTTNLFDAQVSGRDSYVYGTDYKLGDRVMVSIRGVHQAARILEFIISVDGSGFRAYPTFEYES